jgi:hypothetical protein
VHLSQLCRVDLVVVVPLVVVGLELDLLVRVVVLVPVLKSVANHLNLLMVAQTFEPDVLLEWEVRLDHHLHHHYLQL